MRFPGFEDDWEQTILGNECVVNPKTEPLSEEFVYIDLESVVKGELVKEVVVEKSDAPSRAQRVLNENDILFQCVRPYQLNNLLYRTTDDRQWVASTGYAQIRTLHNSSFIYHLLNMPNFNKEVMLRCTGTSYPAISSSGLMEIPISICSPQEQKKIATLLTLIDDRISTQNKIIEQLKTLIKALGQNTFNGNKYQFSKTSLGSICKVKKGEQINGSELSETGTFRVMNGGISPSGYHSKQNSEADTISISEGGNSCGYVQFNKEEFWSGGHCYTLINVDSSISNKYLYYFLKFSEQKIMALRIGSGLPNIQKKDIEDFEIVYPSYNNQLKIVSGLNFLEDKLEIEQLIASNLTIQKQYLLQQMFI